MSDRDEERGKRDPEADLGARIRAAKAALDGKEEATGPTEAQKYNALSLAWRMVLELVVGTLIGAGIGWGLDSLTGWGPAFMIVFGLIGFAAGAKTAISSAQSVGQGARDEDNRR